jgi:hypothetical protein
MEYKGFFIEKNGKYIIIKNNNGSKMYMSQIYNKDEKEIYEIGKKIIDIGIDIINTENKTEWMAFQSIYPLDKNNNIRKYMINPNGIERKNNYRKDYKNKMKIRFTIDFLLFLLILLLMDYKSFSNQLVILITIVNLIISIVGMITSLSKKDFYKLDRLGDKIAVGSALANKQLPSGYGKAVVTGPALRYILPNSIVRIMGIITIIYYLQKSNLLFFIIYMFINAIQILIEFNLLKIKKKYESINEDGVADFIVPR